MRAWGGPKLTWLRLRELLAYDKATGQFTWIAKGSSASRIKVGSVAGTSLNGGGRIIEIAGQACQEHRLAWLYVIGQWPIGDIDHRDCNRSNNAIANLRIATGSQNGANKRRRVDNRSGYKGVSAYKGRWVARITKERVTIQIGTFDTPEAAHTAYVAKAVELFGAFARAA